MGTQWRGRETINRFLVKLWTNNGFKFAATYKIAGNWRKPNWGWQFENILEIDFWYWKLNNWSLTVECGSVGGSMKSNLCISFMASLALVSDEVATIELSQARIEFWKPISLISVTLLFYQHGARDKCVCLIHSSFHWRCAFVLTWLQLNLTTIIHVSSSSIVVPAAYGAVFIDSGRFPPKIHPQIWILTKKNQINANNGYE